MIGSLKASMTGFVTEIMDMYFFETPLQIIRQNQKNLQIGVLKDSIEIFLIAK